MRIFHSVHWYFPKCVLLGGSMKQKGNILTWKKINNDEFLCAALLRTNLWPFHGVRASPQSSSVCSQWSTNVRSNQKIKKWFEENINRILVYFCAQRTKICSYYFLKCSYHPLKAKHRLLTNFENFNQSGRSLDALRGVTKPGDRNFFVSISFFHPKSCCINSLSGVEAFLAVSQNDGKSLILTTGCQNKTYAVTSVTHNNNLNLLHYMRPTKWHLASASPTSLSINSGLSFPTVKEKHDCCSSRVLFTLFLLWL